MREIFARFDKYMIHRHLNDNQVTVQCGLAIGLIGQARKGKSDLGKKTIDKILSTYQDLNRVWLLTGEGNMITSSESNLPPNAGIPFFKDVPVSAGQSGLLYSSNEEAAEGFISIAGVTGKYAFPVIGCSMEPVIHAGDIIVVEEVCQWERIDPDKIYLIITHDDRMIKHLELDEQNSDILWCISSNYKRFSVLKSEIIRIFRVTFYGRLV